MSSFVYLAYLVIREGISAQPRQARKPSPPIDWSKKKKSWKWNRGKSNRATSPANESLMKDPCQ